MRPDARSSPSLLSLPSRCRGRLSNPLSTWFQAPDPTGMLPLFPPEVKFSFGSTYATPYGADVSSPARLNQNQGGRFVLYLQKQGGYPFFFYLASGGRICFTKRKWLSVGLHCARKKLTPLRIKLFAVNPLTRDELINGQNTGSVGMIPNFSAITECGFLFPRERLHLTIMFPANSFPATGCSAPWEATVASTTPRSNHPPASTTSSAVCKRRSAPQALTGELFSFGIALLIGPIAEGIATH